MELKEWNEVYLNVRDYPTGTPGCLIPRKAIHPGDNISWYLPWHFDLDEVCECPVAPITVVRVDAYGLTVSYRDKEYTLNMNQEDKQKVILENNVVVFPTIPATHAWMREPFGFTLSLEIEWTNPRYRQYRSKKDFQSKPDYSKIKEVRTREQIDHDAWQYAVDNDLIPHN